MGVIWFVSFCLIYMHTFYSAINEFVFIKHKATPPQKKLTERFQTYHLRWETLPSPQRQREGPRHGTRTFQHPPAWRISASECFHCLAPAVKEQDVRKKQKRSWLESKQTRTHKWKQGSKRPCFSIIKIQFGSDVEDCVNIGDGGWWPTRREMRRGRIFLMLVPAQGPCHYLCE